MKVLRQLLYALISGLIMYLAIRLVVDPISGSNGWHRPLETIIKELIGSFVIAYLLIQVLNWRIKTLRNKSRSNIKLSAFLKELGITYLYCFIVLNLTATPLMMFTDNGLQVYDSIVVNIIPMLFILLYFSIVRGQTFLGDYIESKLALDKLENEQLQTELRFLKSQFHPHFLFNALNTVYFQMDENVPEAKTSLEKLSELLRYQLYIEGKEKVTISKELNHLNNFIALQKARKSQNLELKVTFDEQLKEQTIHPFLLIPLVENAFKYVDSSGRIKIDARLSEKSLLFKVENTFEKEHAHKTEVGGLGLTNLQRRIKLLYEDSASLVITIEGNQFSSLLTVPLHEN